MTPEKPTLRAMVSDGASVRRIIDYVQEQLKDPKCTVAIDCSDCCGWGAVIARSSGAVLNIGHSRSYDQKEPIGTLVELTEKIDEAIAHYWELNAETHKPRCVADALGLGTIADDLEEGA